MGIEVLKIEETIIDEEFFTEEAIRSRADKIMKRVTDEDLEEFGFDREEFREMLISFGESFGKPCKKLDMKEIEQRYMELTKELAEDE